jgi:luciferase family oxidoreductase group 1
MLKRLSEIPVSVLDLATIIEGDASAADAFSRSVHFAQHAEKLGYNRYWFAEHHNMATVASSATAVLIGHIAGKTTTLRVGSGGVMLPNHAPLVIAEQFGTLASLFPGRIDLGIGRAPGTDQLTAQALRRNLNGGVDNFPSDVVELMNFLGPKDPAAKVRAVPGEETRVPVWLLGSSTFSANLAARLGLPFAFASHFAPAYLKEALYYYKKDFTPSVYLKEPYAIACVNVIVADTDYEADYLATSMYQMVLRMIRNVRRPLPPPVSSMDGLWSEPERQAALQMLYYSFAGSNESVADALQTFLDQTGVDEIMVSCHVHDKMAKLASMTKTAALFHTKVNAPLAQTF